jgi:hypothetical protein
LILANKKTKAQLEAELKVLRNARISEGFVHVFNNMIRWGAIVLIVRYGYLSLEALAGKSTLADVAINFLTNVNVSVTLAWTAGVFGVLYGVKQRKLRKDTIQRLQSRIQALESQLDPKRTTSNLTSRGDTRPEDIV